LVPRTGLEPAHLAALPPEDSASTNFAIWALQRTGCKYTKNRRLSQWNCAFPKPNCNPYNYKINMASP